MHPQHGHNCFMRITAPALATGVAVVLVVAAMLGNRAAQQARQEAPPGTQTDSMRLPLLPTLYFEQTGHHLSNRAGFLDFWRANGQVLIFGYPISEGLIEGGRIVQYFERARFEYHPKLLGQPGQVQLGLIGRELVDAPTPNLVAVGAILLALVGLHIRRVADDHIETLRNSQQASRGGLAIFERLKEALLLSESHRFEDGHAGT